MSHLLALQSDVVNAFLESAEAREPWRRLFVRAAIDDAGTMRATALLARDPPDPDKPLSLRLPTALVSALLALHAGCRTAGQAFSQLFLTIEAPDGTYQFEFEHEPLPELTRSLLSALDQRLEARYREAFPVRAAAAPARPVAQPAPLSQIARAYQTFAARADAEARPRIATFLRAMARGEAAKQAARLTLSEPVTLTEQLRAARALEIERMDRLEGIARSPSVPRHIQERCSIGAQVALSACSLLKVALDRHEEGLDLGSGGSNLVCSGCGEVFFGAASVTCHLCGAPRTGFIEVK